MNRTPEEAKIINDRLETLKSLNKHIIKELEKRETPEFVAAHHALISVLEGFLQMMNGEFKDD
jgi:hypothetical protein